MGQENSTPGLLGNYFFPSPSVHRMQLLSTNPVLIAFGTVSLDHSKMLNFHSGIPQEPLSPRKQPTPGCVRAGGGVRGGEVLGFLVKHRKLFFDSCHPLCTHTYTHVQKYVHKLINLAANLRYMLNTCLFLSVCNAVECCNHIMTPL